MPLYFFSTTHGDVTNERTDGIEFSNDDQAWGEATSSCGEILRHLDGELLKTGEWRMDVTNEKRELIFRLTLIPQAFRK